MARITIEDCTEHVANHFHLVQMAAIRTKQLKKGARGLVQAEENKAVVAILRWIERVDEKKPCQIACNT